MVSAEEAANRVAAFLDKHAELNGTKSDFLLQYEHTHYALRTSDLRELISALTEDDPFMWYVYKGHMYHAMCNKEVKAVKHHGYGLLKCECGATSR